MSARLFIDEKQRQNLADLLTACPSMRNSRARELVIQQLRPVIQEKIRAEGNPASVVSELVGICVHHPDGIEDLVRATEGIERNSIPMGQLWEELPEVLGFFDEDVHEDIGDVLKCLDDGHLKRDAIENAFKKTIPDRIRKDLGLPGVKWMCRWRLLKEAARVSKSPDGKFPFSFFVRRLWQNISDPKMGESLLRWAAHVTGESETSLKRPVDENQEPSTADVSEKLRLIVCLEPHPHDSKLYRPFFPLEEGNNHREYQPSYDEKKYPNGFLPLELVSSELDRFLLDFEGDRLPDAIEILMPAESIAELKPPPHLWELKINRPAETILGKQYPVYLRINRRKYRGEKLPGDLERDWKKKWWKLKKLDFHADCIHWESNPSACS